MVIYNISGNSRSQNVLKNHQPVKCKQRLSVMFTSVESMNLKLCLHYKLGVWFSCLHTPTHSSSHQASVNINSSIATTGAEEAQLSHAV